MGLDKKIIEQLEAYVELLEEDLIITASLSDDSASQQMRSFLEEIIALSPKLSLKEDALSRTPSFRIDQHKNEVGISFAAVPLGHELSSFVLALVQGSGRAPKIDEALIKKIKSIDKELHFETYVSLSCHICPDVVQALNTMAVLNPKISHTMIDGGIFKDEIDAKDIMAVPTVYLNDEEFAAGRTTLEEFVDMVAGPSDLDIDLSTPYDVLVVGGGPAGASAAIYAVRKGLKVGIISDRIGGQVLETLSIENVIGTTHTEGPKLAQDLHNHMKDYDIDIISNQVVTSVSKEDLVTVSLESGHEIVSKTLILATGAGWRNVNVPGEKEFKNKGVAYCPHCDGPLFKDKNVAVIGGGNSGVEAAIDLAQIVKHVTVVEFAEDLKADDVLQKSLYKLDNVTVHKNAMTKEIHGHTSVTGLSFEDRATQKSQTIDIDGVFVQIGLVPNTAFLDDQFEKTALGELVVNEKNETSVTGIFAAGDCTNSKYKQIIISMGSGASAALSAFDYLMRENN